MLILSGSGDVLLDGTGNLVGGRVSGEPVGDLKASADLAKGALETSGSSFKLKSGISLDDNVLVGGFRASRLSNIDNNGRFQGDLGSNATLDGDDIADIKTGANRANTVIDSNNKIVGDIKEDTATIGGTAISTVKSRAETSLSEYIIYSDNTQADSGTTATVNVLPTYSRNSVTVSSTMTNIVTSKIKFLFRHLAVNIR